MNPLSIINLQISNFMRVEAAEISPNGSPIIQITGKNAAGKSSVINAIWAALCWRAANGSIPEPIRRGQESAQVRIDLGDLIVTRTWKGEKSTLTVTTREGAKYPSPQSVLDKLVSEIGFDPLAFTRMQPRDQRSTLMNLLKIDFRQYDEERIELLKQRHYVGSAYRSIEMQLTDLPSVPKDTPDEEVSAGDLIQKIQDTQSIQNKYQIMMDEKISEERYLVITQKEISDLEDALLDARYRFENISAKIQKLNHSIESMVLPDVTPLQEQLNNIETINKQVRLKQQARKLSIDLEVKESELNQIEEAIGNIDQDKRDALAAAKFPVPGLSFDETGILLNGVPFAQASTAEQIRVSLAMGIALNPDLRVLLIRDGNALDSDSLQIVEDMARDCGMQVWMERVDESRQIGIVIEDGTVRETVPLGQQVLA
jgi:DNA repair exonuclease SbcCD ATPase subunit